MQFGANWCSLEAMSAVWGQLVQFGSDECSLEPIDAVWER